MIVEEFLTLPPFLHFEGAGFELQMLNNGGNELRIGYILRSVNPYSPHKTVFDKYGSWYNKIANPDNPPLQGFLQLYEKIETDVDLIWAMRQLWIWFCDHAHQFPTELL